jgi:ribosome-associated translation inhibitor RaiA
MRIEIHAKNIEVDESLRAQVQRGLGQAIGRFDEFIRRVIVHLATSNGVRGARENKCRICVSLKSWGDVEIEDSDADLHAVTARATGRVGLAVHNELWRLRESKRGCATSDE